jgi:hypothetical protein
MSIADVLEACTIAKISERRHFAGPRETAGMNHLSEKTTFQPEELNALKDLFDDITRQRWFDPSEGAREAFGRYLIETFPAAMYDARHHRLIVEASARAFYARRASEA